MRDSDSNQITSLPLCFTSLPPLLPPLLSQHRNTLHNRIAGPKIQDTFRKWGESPRVQVIQSGQSRSESCAKGTHNFCTVINECSVQISDVPQANKWPTDHQYNVFVRKLTNLLATNNYHKASLFVIVLPCFCISWFDNGYKWNGNNYLINWKITDPSLLFF